MSTVLLSSALWPFILLVHLRLRQSKLYRQFDQCNVCPFIYIKYRGSTACSESPDRRHEHGSGRVQTAQHYVRLYVGNMVWNLAMRDELRDQARHMDFMRDCVVDSSPRFRTPMNLISSQINRLMIDVVIGMYGGRTSWGASGRTRCGC